MSLLKHFFTIEDWFLGAVRDGKAYRAWDEQLIEVAGSYYYRIQTGSKPVLFQASFIKSDSAPLKTKTYVGSTGITGGSPVTTYNLNTVLNTPAETIITSGVTVGSIGIQTDQDNLYGTEKASVSPSRSDSHLLRLSDANTDVIFEVAAPSNNTEVLVKLLWVET